MGIDDDIAAHLPEPPPPAPAQRQATIGEAMRRFDAVHHGGPAAAEPPPAVREPWFARIGRPQAAGLVAAGLVALFGVPAAWLSVSHKSAPVSHEQLASTRESATTADQVEPEPQVRLSPREPSPALRAPTMVAPPAIVAAPVVAPASPAVQNQPRQEVASAASVDEPKAAAAAAPAMQLARADAMRSSDAEGRVAPARQGYGSASRKAVPLADAPPPPPPPAMAATTEAANFASSDIQVTAQRRAERLSSVPVSIAGGARRSRKTADRGDWNACTINDPDHSLRNCKRLIDPAAAGAKGRASAHVADGLSRAWQGDLDGAIAAFDRAIAISPRDAVAYLNRGLALQRKGEFGRANADLDRAVRYAPGAARGYYNRSLLLRQRGEADSASADEDRAVELDPGYGAVVQ